jgi:hypothetical protein
VNDSVRFRAPYAALEILSLRADGSAGTRLLDVGGGYGVHTNFFRGRGFTVDLVDVSSGQPTRHFVGDFLDFRPAGRYDITWASHVLEHVQNPGLFIGHLIDCTKPAGLICVTVPPLKSEMTFGHVTLWNAGLLLINLIKSGLDCRHARLMTYGYNVSVIVANRLRTDNHYANWLPPGIEVRNGYFDGDIQAINWVTDRIPRQFRIPGYDEQPFATTAARLSGHTSDGFVLCLDHDSGKPRFHWWDAAAQRLVLVS